MENFDEWKKNFSLERDGIEQLRPGTQDILKEVATKKKSMVAVAVQVIFALLALSSFATQMTVAIKWLTISPLLSLVIFGKELFGLFMVIKPSLFILIKKPDMIVGDALFDPFHEKFGLFNFLVDKIPLHLRTQISALVFAVASLSNPRTFFASAINARYQMAPCLINSDILSQKLGNVMFLAIDLVIKTKNDDKAINIWLFQGLLVNVALIVLSLWNQNKVFVKLYDWLADISEGKLLPIEVKAGLVYLYSTNIGQDAAQKFVDCALGVAKRPIVDTDDKKKKEGVKEEQRKEEKKEEAKDDKEKKE